MIDGVITPIYIIMLFKNEPRLIPFKNFISFFSYLISFLRNRAATSSFAHPVLHEIALLESFIF